MVYYRFVLNRLFRFLRVGVNGGGNNSQSSRREARCREVTNSSSFRPVSRCTIVFVIYETTCTHHAGSRTRMELKAGEKPFRKGARGKKKRLTEGVERTHRWCGMRKSVCSGFNFVPLEEEISTSFIPRLFAPSHRKGNVIIGIPFIRLRNR